MPGKTAKGQIAKTMAAWPTDPNTIRLPSYVASLLARFLSKTREHAGDLAGSVSRIPARLASMTSSSLGNLCLAIIGLAATRPPSHGQRHARLQNTPSGD